MDQPVICFSHVMLAAWLYEWQWLVHHFGNISKIKEWIAIKFKAYISSTKIMKPTDFRVSPTFPHYKVTIGFLCKNSWFHEKESR